MKKPQNFPFFAAPYHKPCPKKRESLQQGFASQSPEKIVGTNFKKNGKKCFNSDTEDHGISKYVRTTPADHLSFPFNPSMGIRLHCKANLRSRHVWDSRSQSEDNY